MTPPRGRNIRCPPPALKSVVLAGVPCRPLPSPMPASFDGKLVVAISSRALFDLEDANRVFEEQGVKAYHTYQLEHENEVLAPGIAFLLVRKLLALNTLAPARPRVEVILLSRNTADTGMRVMNAIEHYKLDITRAAFTGGENTYPYVPAFDAHLFLSANPQDVRKALDAGHAAATILPSNVGQNERDERRVAHRVRRRRRALLRRGRARLQARGAGGLHRERSQRRQGAALGRSFQELPCGAAPHPVRVSARARCRSARHW